MRIFVEGAIKWYLVYHHSIHCFQLAQLHKSSVKKKKTQPLAMNSNMCSMVTKVYSQSHTLTLGFRDFRYCPTPETVPPLPIPITKMSTCPFVSSHISGPVVSKCTCFFPFCNNRLRIELDEYNLEK